MLCIVHVQQQYWQQSIYNKFKRDVKIGVNIVCEIKCHINLIRYIPLQIVLKGQFFLL